MSGLRGSAGASAEAERLRPQMKRDRETGVTLEYFVLDVFTETALAGNPLAVFFHDGLLSTERMQQIAREMQLSETTFVERREAGIESAEGVRVRIFTTEEELPFAGHPTLGTASLLRAIARERVTRVGGAEVVRLDLRAGCIPVRFEQASDSAPLWPMRGEMTQRDPEFLDELDRSTVAKLVGLEEADIDPERPVQIVSTGTAFAIVPLRSAEALSGLRVRQEEAAAYLRPRGARWFYILGPELTASSLLADSMLNDPAGADSLPVWRARMQFHGGEDPATGSAAGCAISYLVAHGAVSSEQRVHLRQGVEMGRPSDLFLSARLVSSAGSGSAGGGSVVCDVRVAGSVMLVARGEFFPQ